MNRLRYHILVWAAFISVETSWAWYTPDPQHWQVICINYASLILLFYAYRAVASKYWATFHAPIDIKEGAKGYQVRARSPFRHYVLRWELAAVVGLLFAFIGFAWFAEDLYISEGWMEGPQDHFSYFTYRKWNTQSKFQFGGITMAAIEYILIREARRRKALNEAAERYKRTAQDLADATDDDEQE